MMTVHGGKIPNPEWKWVFVSSVSALFFVILIFAAGAFMECMNGGCAVVFTSIFLAITSAAVAFLFFSRARSMDSILGGENLLVRWIYPADLAAKTAMEEFISYKEANRSLLSVVVGFFLIAIVLLLLFGGEAGGITAGVMCIILAILALVAWGAPRIEYSRAQKAIPEAYISRNGIIFGGTVYPFRSFLNNLQEVGYSKGTRNIISPAQKKP